jgi:hypothetical protein
MTIGSEPTTSLTSLKSGSATPPTPAGNPSKDGQGGLNTRVFQNVIRQDIQSVVAGYLNPQGTANLLQVLLGEDQGSQETEIKDRVSPENKQGVRYLSKKLEEVKEKEQTFAQVVTELGTIDGDPFVALLKTKGNVHVSVVQRTVETDLGLLEPHISIQSFIQLDGVSEKDKEALETALTATSKVSSFSGGNSKRHYTLEPLRGRENAYEVKVTWEVHNLPFPDEGNNLFAGNW